MVKFDDLKSPQPLFGFVIIHFLSEEEFLSLIDKKHSDFINLVLDECYRERKIMLPGIIAAMCKLTDDAPEFYKSLKKGSLVLINRHCGYKFEYCGSPLSFHEMGRIEFDFSEILNRS